MTPREFHNATKGHYETVQQQQEFEQRLTYESARYNAANIMQALSGSVKNYTDLGFFPWEKKKTTKKQRIINRQEQKKRLATMAERYKQQKLI